jgi:hypothetical protein
MIVRSSRLARVWWKVAHAKRIDSIAVLISLLDFGDTDR